MQREKDRKKTWRFLPVLGGSLSTGTKTLVLIWEALIQGWDTSATDTSQHGTQQLT